MHRSILILFISALLCIPVQNLTVVNVSLFDTEYSNDVRGIISKQNDATIQLSANATYNRLRDIVSHYAERTGGVLTLEAAPGQTASTSVWVDAANLQGLAAGTNGSVIVIKRLRLLNTCFTPRKKSIHNAAAFSTFVATGSDMLEQPRCGRQHGPGLHCSKKNQTCSDLHDAMIYLVRVACKGMQSAQR